MIRPARSTDSAEIVALNQADLLRLSPLTLASLDPLGQVASYFRVAEKGGHVAGFLLAMAAKAAYESVNFFWFKNRYASFLYIDRIVVAHDR